MIREQRIHPALPSPVHAVDPKVIVITPEIAKQLVEEVEAGERQPFTLYAVDEVGKEKIEGWFIDNLRWARQIMAVIGYYRKEEDEPVQ